jgi:ribosomal protein S18 acetylase RimI-like enzyme
MTIADEVLVAADQNMVRAWRAVLAGSPIPGDIHDDDVVLLSSGLPVPLFNPAFVTRPPADPGATVARVVDHYASLGAPFVLDFRDEVAFGLAEACTAAGLVEHWRPALMVLDPIPPTVAQAPSDLEVSRVTTETLDDYSAVLSAGFGIPLELTDLVSGPWLLSVAAGLIGTVQGEPTGSAAVFVSEGVAGIYNVATVPQGRGKGIGEAMTWAAVRAGQEAGATCAILQSSEQGEPVYRRMGFATPTRYRQFQPPGGPS